jgi:hypothetical protein
MSKASRAIWVILHMLRTYSPGFLRELWWMAVIMLITMVLLGFLYLGVDILYKINSLVPH